MSNENRVTHHTVWVRTLHWIITASVIVLMYSGFTILRCHPRLYWGEAGNDLTPALFELPISRNYQHGGWSDNSAFFDDQSQISASRTYDIFNENGWGRSLHFLAGWFLFVAGLVYLIFAIVRGHLKKHLLPSKSDLTTQAFKEDFVNHLHMKITPPTGGPSYGVIQKSTYISVILILLPLMILTGLAMSPALTTAYPFLSDMFAGSQSARTIHFFTSSALFAFLIVHLAMIFLSGFKNHIRFMTIGKRNEK